MCTVLLRLDPDGVHPVLLGAVRDEFVERPWDPPARHWTGAATGLIGGRDRLAGRHLARRRPRATRGGSPPQRRSPRRTRGRTASTDPRHPRPAHPHRRGPTGGRSTATTASTCCAPTSTAASSGRGTATTLTHVDLAAGDHIIVNAGLDTDADPLVPHFAPLLAALPSTPDAWLELLAGDGLDPGDERALIVAKEIEGRAYGSTSASLVALSPDRRPLRLHRHASPPRPGGGSTPAGRLTSPNPSAAGS